jgi:hypothetical protein
MYPEAMIISGERFFRIYDPQGENNGFNGCGEGGEKNIFYIVAVVIRS